MDILFTPFCREGIRSYLNIREGEEKLGEHVICVDEGWEDTAAQFVIFGIQEDVGIRRNGGIGTAKGALIPFLKAFLNIQDNIFLSGRDFILHGYFSVENESEDVLRQLDNAVSEKIEAVIRAGKTPVVIGGGHNNSYGMIKGCSRALNAAVGVINLDAHADLRETDTRHSGNGFSFAYEEGYLEKYAMLGLHEGYNNSFIISSVNQRERLKAIYYEDIVLRQKQTFEQAVHECIDFVKDGRWGTEWDVDSMENMLSSAMTPAGWHMHQVLHFLYKAGQNDSLYLHISEAAAERADGLKQPSAGKVLSYAVQAFVKGKKELNIK